MNKVTMVNHPTSRRELAIETLLTVDACMRHWDKQVEDAANLKMDSANLLLAAVTGMALVEQLALQSTRDVRTLFYDAFNDVEELNEVFSIYEALKRTDGMYYDAMNRTTNIDHIFGVVWSNGKLYLVPVQEGCDFSLQPIEVTDDCRLELSPWAVGSRVRSFGTLEKSVASFNSLTLQSTTPHAIIGLLYL